MLALMQKKTIDWILSLELTGQGEDFRDLAFRAVEAVRSVAAARERLLKSVVIADDMTERARRLEQELAREAAVTRQGIFEDRGTPKPLFQDPASFLAHILERDRLEREVAALYVGLASQQGLAFHADRQAIAGALPPGSVAVGYWCYSVERVGSKTQQVASPVASYLAFVLRPDGSMARVELGPAQAIEDALKEYRDAIGVAGGRGTPLVAQLGTEARERDVGERLRALVLDPLLPHLGNAKRLIIAPDDVLHLIPLAALPLDRGAVAARYDIELRTSLKEITVSKQPTLNPPSLLALGGIAYDHSGGSTAGPVASAEGIVRGATRDAVRAGPWELGFVPLPETRGEVVGVDALFRTAFEHAPGDVLLGEAATRDALAQFAPKARFVHLATHGYFTPESVAASIKDDRSLGARASPGRIMPFDEQVRGFAPMELCGLAFAGANLPPDRYGFIPGVMTASEIARLDLRRCELVVLSACDTNVGVRRAGQGIASLQQAVYAAGARASLTSLWKVPDEATRELMIDFYRRMWIERKPKRQALFESQEKMRTARDERGRPKYRTRDWAAWVLVGEE
ncbi:MAG: CHAT domain-containing protein [Planctomycetota bacterium]